MSNQDRDRRSEIDAFKEINLSVIASSFGYRIVKNKSTRHSVLMESGNDKIIVSKNGRHYVYCSVYTESNGTVIDFIQRVVEPNCSLGKVRQHLRPFLDGSYFSNVQKEHAGKYAVSIRPSSKDLLAVAARFSKFEPVTTFHPYLCGERGIPVELLQHDRLKMRVMHCPKRSSIVFPHWGSSDNSSSETERCVTGYEIKGKGINMFSKAGRKGLWASAGFKHDRVLVFAESGLDALSYLALHPMNDVRIASVSGQLTPYQCDLICSAIGRMEEGTQVVAAFDNDKAGDKLTETVAMLSAELGYKFKENRPTTDGLDWNDVLLQSCPKNHLSPYVGS